jgi:hypothetical protein
MATLRDGSRCDDPTEALHLCSLPFEIRHKILTYALLFHAYEFEYPFAKYSIPLDRPLLPIFSTNTIKEQVGDQFWDGKTLGDKIHAANACEQTDLYGGLRYLTPRVCASLSMVRPAEARAMDIGAKGEKPESLGGDETYPPPVSFITGSGVMENRSDPGGDMYLPECTVLAENIPGLKSARRQVLFLLDFRQTPALIAANVDRGMRRVAAFDKGVEVMVFHEPTELDQSYSDLYKKAIPARSMTAIVGECQRRLGLRQLHSNWTGMIL